MRSGSSDLGHLLMPLLVQAVDHILGPGREGVHIFNLGTGTGATVMEVGTMQCLVFSQGIPTTAA